MLVAAGAHTTFEASASLKVISFQRVPPHHVPGRAALAPFACVAVTRANAAAASTAATFAARATV
jgi:hypothetical protein